MRLEVPQRHLTLDAGSAGTIDIEVFNTGSTIDGVTARIVGLDESWVTSEPGQLALFPETSGRMHLRITLPPEFPAGEHVVTVEVSSSVDPTDVVYADVVLEVLPLAQATMMLLPATVVARRKGEFSVLTENTGNTPISLALSGADPERSLRFAFEPSTIDVDPGESASTVLLVQGRRRLFGSDNNHAVTVLAEAVDLDIEARGVFTQRPVLPRGPLTALALAAIVLLWAAALLIGLSKTLGNDPLSKAAPASFFAGIPYGTPGKAASTAPAGAVQKSGVASKDLGGTITGTVRAANTQAGVGRITVEAIRRSRNGPVLVASAATQEDGTYTVGGLFPGTYVLRYSSQGYQDVWYPAAPGLSNAATVEVATASATKRTDVVIVGLPGSIAGKVDTGATSVPVPVSVAVHPIVSNVAGPTVATVAVDSAQNFAVPNLAAPGSYELDFSAPGYQPTSVVQRLNGGQSAITNIVQLSAASGSISGFVSSDGTNGLGAVVVTAISGDKSVTTATPTTGTLGRYIFDGLVSPQTYLVTFAKPGFGSQTIAIDLRPGERRDNVDAVLAGGTGSITGQVVNGDQQPLGNVTVTVTGGTTNVSTQTLTASGNFFVSALPTPALYAVTFTLPGFASQTQPVLLDTGGAAPPLQVTMPSTLGTLSGVVVGSSGAGLAGVANATVSLTDGSNVRTTTTASVPAAGSFQVSSIAAGTYTVTVSAPGFEQRSALLTIAPGNNSLPADFQLVASP